MNIEQIKTQIEQPVLNMVRQLDDKKQPTSWLSHWDDAKRVRVTIPEQVYNQILENRNFDRLAIKTETVQPKDTTKLPYTRYVVITPKNLEGTL